MCPSIQPGVVAVSCIYSLYHHARPARSRPPASSAAYQLFSSVHDAAAAGLYAVGALTVHNQGGEWTTLLDNSNKDLATAASSYLVPAEYYALIAASGLHAASLGISTYLAVSFHRIARMPPDMNPLEDHLTRRAHKRNKSSVATTGSWESADSGNTKRISTRLEEHRRSGAPYEDLEVRPPSIPFMHTRTGSRESIASSVTLTSPTTPNSKRDSRADLPSRQYQVLPGNNGNGSTTNVNAKRMSAPPVQQGRQQRGSYAEIPLHEPSYFASSRPASIAGAQTLYGNNNSSNSKPSTPTGTPRAPRFTETWYASDSLVGRTQERLRAAEKEKQQQQQQQQKEQQNPAKAYEALVQPYDDLDSESDRENNTMMGPDRRYEMLSDYSDVDDDAGEEQEGRTSLYPDPLRAHPPTSFAAKKQRGANNGSSSSILALLQQQPQQPQSQRPRAKTPFRSAIALSEVSANARSASGSQDITDEVNNGGGAYRLSVPKTSSSGRSGNGGGRNRDSSIQPEDAFYSRPYGDLKSATPPMMVGSTRQVSSGHDYYDLGGGSGGPRSYRRNVSGKVAEEGLAGPDRAAAAAAAGNGGGYSRTILKGFMSSMPT